MGGSHSALIVRDGLMSKNKLFMNLFYIIFDDLLHRLGVACPLVPYGDLIHP